MGDKISQIPSATTPLTGSELVPVIQGGTTSKVASSAFKTTNAADLVSGTVNTARLPAASTVSSGIVQLGSAAGTACEGDDARLSNSRTPSGAAGGDLAGTYPNPSLAASGVTAGTYGSGTVAPVVTVDAKGRVTSMGQVNIPIPPASNATPLADGIAQSGVSSSFSRADHIHPAPSTTLTGDVTGSGVGVVAATLANTGVSQGTYGSSNLVPVVTVDAKGRVLAVAETPFSSSQGGTVTSVAASGGSTGLTLSGGPIVNSGTLTLGGTLAIASGGTGSTTAAAALNALGGLPAVEKGALSGVCDLDAGGKVPYARLPGPLGTSQISTLDGNGKVPLAQLYAGTADGLATLDPSGKVPSGQLPSYVDDVIEVANFAALPVTGVAGIIYVTLDTNLTYRWTGSTYVQISAGPTPSSTTPLVAGTAAVGTSLAYARADHVHPTQAGSATPLIAAGAGSVGTSTLFAREDHVHPAQAFSNVDGGSPSLVGGLIQMRRGTASQWTSSNPVLSSGEIGSETDTGRLKIGNGTSTWSQLQYFSAEGYPIDFLVVAGGGGGGTRTAGGGGGGGGVFDSSTTVAKGQSFQVVIGAGGVGDSTQNSGSPLAGLGGNTTFGAIVASGSGFGGGNSFTGSSWLPQSGGSGGGGKGELTGFAGANGTTNQGNSGGSGSRNDTFQNAAGGGGGGAVSAGGNAVTASGNVTGGSGGAGLNWRGLGSSYGGGGGGGATFNAGTGTSGSGGSGGGGAGGTANTAGTGGNGVNGTANTGGGGGGAAGQWGNPTTSLGGNGGSGIVVVRYPGAQRGTGGTITSSGGYTYHTFTTSGTFIA